MVELVLKEDKCFFKNMLISFSFFVKTLHWRSNPINADYVDEIGICDVFMRAARLAHAVEDATSSPAEPCHHLPAVGPADAPLPLHYAQGAGGPWRGARTRDRDTPTELARRLVLLAPGFVGDSIRSCSQLEQQK